MEPLNPPSQHESNPGIVRSAGQQPTELPRLLQQNRTNFIECAVYAQMRLLLKICYIFCLTGIRLLVIDLDELCWLNLVCQLLTWFASCKSCEQ